MKKVLVVVFVVLALLPACKKSQDGWFTQAELADLGITGLAPIPKKTLVPGSARNSWVMHDATPEEYADFAYDAYTKIVNNNTNVYSAEYDAYENVSALHKATLSKEDIAKLIGEQEATSMVDFFYKAGEKIFHTMTVYNPVGYPAGAVAFTITDMTDTLGGITILD